MKSGGQLRPRPFREFRLGLSLSPRALRAKGTTTMLRGVYSSAVGRVRKATTDTFKHSNFLGHAGPGLGGACAHQAPGHWLVRRLLPCAPPPSTIHNKAATNHSTLRLGPRASQGTRSSGMLSRPYHRQVHLHHQTSSTVVEGGRARVAGRHAADGPRGPKKVRRAPPSRPAPALAAHLGASVGAQIGGAARGRGAGVGGVGREVLGRVEAGRTE